MLETIEAVYSGFVLFSAVYCSCVIIISVVDLLSLNQMVIQCVSVQ